MVGPVPASPRPTGPTGSGSGVLRSLRLRILSEVSQPASAAAVARRLGAPRQKVAYHVRELEREGLVECVEERQRGNCRERIVKATARAYLVGADAISRIAADPATARDRLSSGYLVAVAAQAVHEVAVLRLKAQAAGKPIATLTLQTDVRFGSSAQRAAFAEELSGLVATLAAKYQNSEAPGGRPYRLFLGVYPAPPPSDKGAHHG